MPRCVPHHTPTLVGARCPPNSPCLRSQGSPHAVRSHAPTRVGCATRLPRLPATTHGSMLRCLHHTYSVVGCSANLLRPACDNSPPIETASIATARRARIGCALLACRALPATAELVAQMHTASHTYSRRRSLLRCMLHHTPTRVGCAARLTRLASPIAGLTACSAVGHTPTHVGCATRLPRLPATAGLDAQMPASHLPS